MFGHRARALSGVTESLTAKHYDPSGREGLHEHTWTVTLFFASYPYRDRRYSKQELRELLDCMPWKDGVLPDRFFSGEAIIAYCVQNSEECVGGVVRREEGYEAFYWL